MKDRLSEKNNELFKSIISELDGTPTYDLDLENKTMQMIDIEVDHSMTIQKYKKWSKLGFNISIGLILILFIFSAKSILDAVNLQPDQIEIKHYIPSFFALIGLILIFVQLQIKNQSNSMR